MGGCVGGCGSGGKAEMEMRGGDGGGGRSGGEL